MTPTDKQIEAVARAIEAIPVYCPYSGDFISLSDDEALGMAKAAITAYQETLEEI